MLLIISGSSGVGKNTIIEELKKRHPEFKHFASFTTRDKREGEVDGGNYHHVSREEFLRRVENGDICEYEQSHGNLYGCSLSVIRDRHSDDIVLTKDLGVEGAINLKKMLKDELPIMTIFLTLDKDELRKRLEGRGEKDIDLRLSRYDYEQTFIPHYDVVINNIDIDETINTILRKVKGVNKMKEKILVTAALPYINNVPHIGHVIGSHLPADVFARFNRTFGNEVVFIGGADEHGTPAVVLSNETGVPVKTIVDTLKVEHKKVYDKLNISYDNFSGTSIPLHTEITQDFFNKMNQNGYIFTETVEQYYCEHCKMFLPDRFLRGTCPKCGYDDCDGDQCEKCFSVHSADELINPHCYNCGTKPIIKQSKHLFFDMPKTSKLLGEYLEEKKDVFKPYVYAEAKRWLTEGLKSRCITRDMKWGVPVNAEGFDEKVFYVWFEAVLGYISFTKEYSPEFYESVWKKGEGKIIHFLGKDNIPFHSVFFPSMLIANGEHSMPYDVAGYNFLNYEGQKFSKSKRIGVFCTPLLTSDLEVDAFRGYLINILPESKDSDWKWEEFKNFVNSELVGKFGNFFNRTINLLYKNFPTLDIGFDDLQLNDEDKKLIEVIKTRSAEITELYKTIKLRDALRNVMLLSIEGNGYLEKQAPWTMIKEGRVEEAKKVLYICLNFCRTLAILASPVLPDKTQEIWEQLNLVGKANASDNWDLVGKIDLPKGHIINAPKPLFRRIDEDYLEKLKEEFSVPFELNFDK